MSPEQEFHDRFGRPPTVIARAPGRVNLIGEHTDYNDGWVLPIALEQATLVAAAPRSDNRLRVYSAAFDEQTEWPLGAWSAAESPAWSAYPAGVAELVSAQAGAKVGADLHLWTDVPLGGGLSSSASVEVATALAVSVLQGLQLSPREVIDLSRRAEHDFAGVPCGIMDQTVVVEGQADAALLIDCRSRATEPIPFELHDHAVFVLDSGVRHSLASGEYARRRAQCATAVAHFQTDGAAIASLRDVDPQLLEASAEGLDPMIHRRARHVVTENVRTLSAVAALRAGDLSTFGRLMNESHDSLRDDYEVSCPELDDLVASLRQIKGVRGARMTGGGFGGCAIALAERRFEPEITDCWQAVLARHAGRPALEPLIVRPGDGARLLTP